MLHTCAHAHDAFCVHSRAHAACRRPYIEGMQPPIHFHAPVHRCSATTCVACRHALAGRHIRSRDVLCCLHCAWVWVWARVCVCVGVCVCVCVGAVAVLPSCSLCLWSVREGDGSARERDAETQTECASERASRRNIYRGAEHARE